MAKVSIKSEKITPVGGIFHVREQFSPLGRPPSVHRGAVGESEKFFGHRGRAVGEGQKF